eukprot:855129-Rhodomonas_salina.2
MAGGQVNSGVWLCAGEAMPGSDGLNVANQLHSEMTKLADAKARLARLAKKKRAAEQQVKADLKSREQAAIEVSDEQNTLTRATSLVDRARFPPN